MNLRTSELSASLRCYRARTTGGCVTCFATPKFRLRAKLHISLKGYTPRIERMR